MTKVSTPLRDGYRFNTPRELSTPHLGCKVEASPPSMSETYFDSPIRTLRQSVKDSGEFDILAHDLIEAYSVLSIRVRHVVYETPSPTTASSSLPSLQVFAEYSSEIIQCVSRDVQCLLHSPFDSYPQHDYSGDQSSDLETNWEDVQIQADNKSLCLYALRFASDLFTFSVLYSQFSGENTVILFNILFNLVLQMIPLFHSFVMFSHCVI